MKIHHVFLLSLSLTVAACGGSGGSDNSTNDSASGNDGSSSDASSGSGSGDSSSGGGSTSGGTVRYFGGIDIEEIIEDNEVEVYGYFAKYSSGFDLDLAVASFEPARDTCTVTTVGFDVDPDDYLTPDFDSTVAAETVSAGDVLTLMSGAGSYIELVRETALGLTFYSSSPETVDGPIPAQLTLNIPGDEFPAFSNISMPVVQTLLMTAPTSTSSITPTTNITWIAGSNPDALLDISVFKINANSTFTSVDCIASDDGSFSFPAQTQAEMGSDFVGLPLEASRYVIELHQQGDALLLLTASSE